MSTVTAFIFYLKLISFFNYRTRGEFRAAQLQANRNAELSKRKERELLFSKPRDDDTQRKSSSKLTHDDLVVNASSDVTAALRRTHELMQAELSRSQFAQETLGLLSSALRHDEDWMVINPFYRTVNRGIIVSLRILQ